MKKLFQNYNTTMSHLNKTYPKTTFVHVTVPLQVVQTGILVPLKKLVGRAIGGYEDNIRRNEFNVLLRKKYHAEMPFFDLAKVESTFPDGTRETFTRHGKTYYSLAPDYTPDGGHLNELGRKRVAEQLLTVLASISQ